MHMVYFVTNYWIYKHTTSIYIYKQIHKKQTQHTNNNIIYWIYIWYNIMILKFIYFKIKIEVLIKILIILVFNKNKLIEFM